MRYMKPGARPTVFVDEASSLKLKTRCAVLVKLMAHPSRLTKLYSLQFQSEDLLVTERAIISESRS
uniref:Uncharacterized protein n=1 Tax=Nymphaea colorata TaxID=210225 RepID=A0A5K1ASW3_9MAGN